MASNTDQYLLALSGVASPPPALILPFVLMLLAIALLPFIHGPWWERHYPKVALGLGSIVVVYYFFVFQQPLRMLHIMQEYVSFIIYIGSLYMVASGVHIQVKGEARPLLNCAFLLIGSVLSNVIGTTGASMLLIRPWIRMNKYRVTTFHVVFFIFLVSNAGGCLTPIGDPPLFLGYLRGVSFWWVLEHCWFAWAVVLIVLLLVFFVLDRRNFFRAPAAVREKETATETWKVTGLLNLLWLAVILVAVFIQKPFGLRELLMFGAAVGSFFVTPKSIHEANDFTFHPIREVAWLFAGIFMTMVPVLDYLEIHAKGLGLDAPMALFWFTGVLSAVLDNAPTYLTFLAANMGSLDLSIYAVSDVTQYAAQHAQNLTAISLGAVFFGAMTYIGNGPNFMVKSIAQQAGVKVPSFFAYILYYALPILLPVMALVAVLLFRK